MVMVAFYGTFESAESTEDAQTGSIHNKKAAFPSSINLLDKAARTNKKNCFVVLLPLALFFLSDFTKES